LVALKTSPVCQLWTYGKKTDPVANPSKSRPINKKNVAAKKPEVKTKTQRLMAISTSSDKIEESSELWKEKKSIDIFSQRSKKPKTPSHPYPSSSLYHCD